MKAIALVVLIGFSLTLMGWETGDIITTDYSWTDSNGDFQTLHNLTAAGKTVFLFKGADWSPSSTSAAAILNDWLPQQNADSLYFCASFDWSALGYNNLIYSNDLDQITNDFSNGYVPLLVIIANYNVLFYQDNFLDEAFATLPAAYSSFTNMMVLNPIADQIMFIDDELVFDISELFVHPQGELISLAVSGNTNPAVLEASIADNSLYLLALMTGHSQVTILGSTAFETIEYSFNADVYDINDNYILILDLNNSANGNSLASLFEDMYPGGNVFLANDWTTFSLDNADAVCILLGIYNNNYILTEDEVAPAVQYLMNGGNLYMEGGDTWAYDNQTSLHNLFNINGIEDGSGDLSTLDGQGFLAGMNWTYSGMNAYIDRLEPVDDAFTIFQNPIVGYDCGVAYDSGEYKTVGTSFEITGLGGNNTIQEAVWGILEFFELVGLPIYPPQNLYVDEGDGIAFWDAPDSSAVVGYNVYLDSVFIAYTNDLTFTFANLINGQQYAAGVTAVYCEGESEMISYDFTFSGVKTDEVISFSTSLTGNFPNPFNPSTEIRFNLAAQQQVSINIYNIRGQIVKNLVDTELPQGSHSIVWNGEDNGSKRVGSGMYLLLMKTDNYNSIKKITLIK